MKSNVEKLVLQQSFYAPKLILVHLSPNVPTTTTRNVYLFSVVQLKGKHCQKPHCHNGVVDMFGPTLSLTLGAFEHVLYIFFPFIVESSAKMAEAGGVPPPQPHSQSPTTMEAYQWAYSIVDSSRVSTFFISILLIVYGSFRSLALEEDNKNANLEQDAKDKENNVKSEERTSGKDK